MERNKQFYSARLKMEKGRYGVIVISLIETGGGAEHFQSRW